MDEVKLVIDGEVFIVRKDILCDHSDYFRAMFSGNYIENTQDEIVINGVDTLSIRTVLKFIDKGYIDCTEINTLGLLLTAANFLQTKAFLKHIEEKLEVQMSFENWAEIFRISQKAFSTKLSQTVAGFGLYNLEFLNPDCIPDLEFLHWYLSHKNLVADEVVIFKFGAQWIKDNKIDANALKMVLGCLDISKLSYDDLKDIKQNTIVRDNISIYGIVDSLMMVKKDTYIDKNSLKAMRNQITTKHNEEVYSEAKEIVENYRKRGENKIICVAAAQNRAEKDIEVKFSDNIDEFINHSESLDNNELLNKVIRLEAEVQCVCKYTQTSGLEKLLDVNSGKLWGWSMSIWGNYKIVITGGEYGRGRSNFEKHVRVWDALKNEWSRHEVELPCVRHAGTVTMGNKLYIIGGVGKYRIVLSSAISYDLKERTIEHLPNLPESVQNPRVVVHKSEIYVAGHENIYKLCDIGWRVILIAPLLGDSGLVSSGGFIYSSGGQSIYKFKPEESNNEFIYTPANRFTYLVSAMCNIGNNLIAFTETMEPNNICVEEYNIDTNVTRSIFTDEDSPYHFYGIGGCGSIVAKLPEIITPDCSPYSVKCLNEIGNSPRLPKPPSEL